MNETTRRPPPPADLDDNPEWTEEMFARARPASEVHGPELAVAMVRKRGRPALAPEARKQQVTLRLSPEVIEALKATGAGWQTRAEEALRRALGIRAAKESAVRSKTTVVEKIPATGGKRYARRDAGGQ
jgi:uncharacterized protein (DUF4415 family)